MKMLAAHVSAARAEFELLERDVPEPRLGCVRIKVEACGVCHSDSFTKEGQIPGLAFPRVPGHEVVGVIDKLGSGVVGWEPGERVGVGWFGGSCHRCDPCRRGRMINCIRLETPGVTYDGGYAEFMVAPVDALARVPDGLASADAAPLLCAGVTTFNALRNSGASPGDLVAIHGIGGLGHLGIQFSRQFGFRTAAIGRGGDKQTLALQLGAHYYLDSDGESVAERLRELGGAKAVIATGPSGKAISDLVDGLTPDGKVVVIAIPSDPLTLTAMQMLSGRSVSGWSSGTSIDSEDTLRFAALSGLRAMIEMFPLAEVRQAYERMMTGKVRFRAVLTMGR
jgi:D-arabinose 1-dehydrogenase-like Zn-dependent alcohol dehydrogenase